ncbi:MAG: amidase family protein, partial [Bryobacteraceae bacterium]
DLNAYLAARGGRVKSLADVIDFNDRNRDREMPYFGQEIMLQAEAKGSIESRAYRDLVSHLNRMAKHDGIDAAMHKHSLDALVAPTGGIAWPIDYAHGDRDVGGCSTPPAVAGYPHVTVPAGFVSGLPVGISFFGSPRTEVKLIRFAYAFEQASMARRPPEFKPGI